MQNIQNARQLLAMVPSQASRSQNYFELGDADGTSPYQSAISELDELIGFAKEIRAELQSLNKHSHEWNSDAYCVVCGADGAA